MQIFKGRSAILTVAPGYGDALKEDQEQQAHAAGRVVVEQFEHIDSALVMRKKNVVRITNTAKNGTPGIRCISISVAQCVIMWTEMAHLRDVG